MGDLIDSAIRLSRHDAMILAMDVQPRDALAAAVHNGLTIDDIRELVELYPSAGRGAAEIPLTQETIAEMAGTSRATVNAVLGEAQTRGFLERARGMIRVLDMEELAWRAR